MQVLNRTMTRPLPRMQDPYAAAETISKLTGDVDHRMFLDMVDIIAIAGKDGVRLQEKCFLFMSLSELTTPVPGLPCASVQLYHTACRNVTVHFTSTCATKVSV